MASRPSFPLVPIGVVRSPLTDPKAAPKQGFEGGPEAWIDVDPALTDALHGLAPGQDLILVTWLDRARRDVLQVHPRDDAARPLTGVFATRSADRPNPIGLHPVRLLERSGARLRVAPLEAVDGTPVLDLKPDLGRAPVAAVTGSVVTRRRRRRRTAS